MCYTHFNLMCLVYSYAYSQNMHMLFRSNWNGFERTLSHLRLPGKLRSINICTCVHVYVTHTYAHTLDRLAMTYVRIHSTFIRNLAVVERTSFRRKSCSVFLLNFKVFFFFAKLINIFHKYFP